MIMALIMKAMEDKLKVQQNLKKLLSSDQIAKASKDYHAKREPRDCGLTIHPATGCVYNCLYCYIEDMNFSMNEITPYKLTGLELAYAVAKNSNVAVGYHGTYFAVGSITEPFHPKVVNKTLEYLNAIKLYLGNHTQISTKSYISLELAKKIRSMAEPNLSFLITIIDLSGKLEPKAPPPKLRFESIANLSKVGFKTVLFIRPVIPGLTDIQLRTLIELAKSYGADGVIVGTLRLTKNILAKLQHAGYKVEEVVQRLRSDLKGRKQVPIVISDIKKKAEKICEDLGINYYPTACAANAIHHNEVCWDLCRYNEEYCPYLPPINEVELKDDLRTLVNLKSITVSSEKWIVVIKTEKCIPKNILYIIQAVFKRHVINKCREKIISTMH